VKAVLYVNHGSRVEKACSEAATFIQSVRQRVDIPLQETCFLELAKPDMAQGIVRLVQRGATKIVIMPVLLLSAGHYYKDIPDEIVSARLRHPQVHFVYGRPIGVQDRVINILEERVQETAGSCHKEANILLVGRGSRYPETSKSIKQIARKLQEKIDVANVDVCFLAACSPSFHEGLKTSVTKGGTQTMVVPYLWFTGLLIHSMQEKINTMAKQSHPIIMCQHLGKHPTMIDALTDRVYEAIEQRDSLRV
jgi:sirohydrochlorin ferrochelatase